jgi:hypothetical protein
VKRQLWVLVAAVAVTAFSTGTAGADPANDKYYDASLLNLSAPTSDPCVTADVRLEVQNYLDDLEPTVMRWSVALIDGCAGGYRAYLGQADNDPLYIRESDFVVDRADGTADLHTTVVGWDWLTRLTSDVTFDLNFSSDAALSDHEVSVTGTVTTAFGQVLFGPEIEWNRWGSDFPWVGLWLCMLHDQTTGPNFHDGWGPSCTGVPEG